MSFDEDREVVKDAQRIASFGASEEVDYFAEPGTPEDHLYRGRQMIHKAAKLLDISLTEALENSIEIETKHVYVWSDSREGAVFIDGDTGKPLYAPASIEFEEHLTSFQRGLRS